MIQIICVEISLLGSDVIYFTNLLNIHFVINKLKFHTEELSYKQIYLIFLKPKKMSFMKQS